MGESIAEGTIVRWMKRVGDAVDRDEPLFEISTDKVDAEIPSPVAGVVAEIRAKEGETVPVNSVVAVIESPASGSLSPGAAWTAPPPASLQESGAASVRPAPAAAPAPPHTAAAAPQPRGAAPTPSQRRPATSRPEAGRSGDSVEELVRQRSSPLVRRIAREHDLDISQIHGTGIAGRVTKNDILAYVSGGGKTGGMPQVESAGVPATAAQAPPLTASSSGRPAPGTVVPMSVMRKKIAEHMVLSRRTSAHVHSVFEVNFFRVAQARDAKKMEYERAGAKLTYLSFILKAVVDALRAVPVVNASVDGDNIVYHKDVNIGIAVALDWGLIVPVIKKADEKNLLGLTRAVADLAERARAKQLKPEEVAGGTFTVTNPGVFGALLGMPIINQPQVAILGVGHVEKRPIVVDDAIAIRPMAYLTLGYDHRLIDGAVGDQFMSEVKRALENWDSSQA
jgi:2-oxoglutarate dehydrogenase E2 component (dihydrolipoamide succinyltransferase)